MLSPRDKLNERERFAENERGEGKGQIGFSSDTECGRFNRVYGGRKESQRNRKKIRCIGGTEANQRGNFGETKIASFTLSDIITKRKGEFGGDLKLGGWKSQLAA